MKKCLYAAAALLFLTVFAACTDDTNIPLCGCEPDEYCVDDECIATDGSVRPAPVTTDSTQN